MRIHRLVLLVLVALVAALSVAFPLTARQLPTTRVQQADLTLLGTFLANDNIWDNGENGAFALGANNDTILLSGWTGSTYGLGEQTIPALGGVSSVVKATGGNLASQFSLIGSDCGSGYITGGQLVYNNLQYVTVATYYDTCNGAQKSLFSAPLSGAVTLGAASKVGTIGASFVSGYMGHVPSEWQSALGGPAVIGQCCLSIISRTSYGPALFAFNPESPATAYPLVYYDSSHQTLGAFDGPNPNPLANGTTRVTGVVLIPGTASALLIGNTGTGPISYGSGTWNAPPYVSYVWAYDLNELAAVKAGSRQPWSVVPYSTFELPGFGSTGKEFSGSCGAGYDPATKRLYVCKPYGTSRAPRIYVYSVNAGTVPPPPPTDTTAPTVSVTAPTNGSAVSGTIVVAATASDNVGVTSVQFTLDGSNLGSADTSAPYQISWDTTTATNASHTLRAVAVDAATNSTTSSAVTITVNNVGTPPPDTTPPTVSVTSPANGQVVSGTINITATASDNVGVSNVQFTINGNNHNAADTSSPYSTTWDTTDDPNGSYTVRAIATDVATNSTTSSAVVVTVSNIVSPPPPVGLVPPVLGTPVASQCRVPFDGVQPPDGNAGWAVRPQRGTTAIGFTDSTAPYTQTITLAGGTYQIRSRWTRSGSTTQYSTYVTVVCQ